jgi:hypothetical protein
MLMKTSHDFSMRFDIELFPRGSCYAPTTAHRDIAANFKVDTGGAWETAAVARAATVKLQSGYDVGYGSFSTDRRCLRDVRCSSDNYQIAASATDVLDQLRRVGKSSIPLS